MIFSNILRINYQVINQHDRRGDQTLTEGKGGKGRKSMTLEVSGGVCILVFSSVVCILVSLTIMLVFQVLVHMWMKVNNLWNGSYGIILLSFLSHIKKIHL